MDNTFGKFLKDKRQQNGLSLRALGKQVKLSHIYLYNIESGKKAPPNDEIIKRLANALNLDEKSRLLFFDIAAQCKSSIDSDNYYIPVDISKYLNENEDARNVIREANKKEQHNSFWNDLLMELKNKYVP
jgi:transcriptional regulator with XRE-family HTH domain